MTTLETLDLANVTGGVTGNDGGCIPPWPRPSGPLGPRDPLGPRNPPVAQFAQIFTMVTQQRPG